MSKVPGIQIYRERSEQRERREQRMEELRNLHKLGMIHDPIRLTLRSQ